ncbi:hypothetical protein Pmani_014834 [Petrolisthes manimaculis]|uniref:Reverse transcriptase/retrotransposon-derived protein RNase H-like domain-containing protein n=1 Tax=Petrolisthes manimaculis TaxID=1843537 RepID=A0AAE1U7Z1_9EUCA|nr:hypothetical protein Pmani_014834 [Petrolisthes manimaculis]
MATLEKFVALGKELGYEGTDLREFVQMEQASERELRQKERDERELEQERELQRHERELQRHERELQRHERELQRQERELQRQEGEREEREKEREENERQRTHELQMAQLSMGPDSHQVTGQPSFQNGLGVVAKRPSLPPFDENKDDLDAYLRRFEAFAESADWSRENWGILFSSYLSGTYLREQQPLTLTKMVERADSYVLAHGGLASNTRSGQDGGSKTSTGETEATGTAPTIPSVQTAGATELKETLPLSRDVYAVVTRAAAGAQVRPRKKLRVIDVTNNFQLDAVEMKKEQAEDSSLNKWMECAREGKPLSRKGMRADVQRFCQSCDSCQRTIPRGKIGRVPLGEMPLIDTPFQRVAVDLVGPIEPRSEDGNREKLEETCRLAQEQLRKSQIRYKNNYDKHTKDRQFSVGDMVLLLLPTAHNKLLLQWKGPYPVIQKKGVMDYGVEIDGHQKVFHANMLRKYIQRSNTVVAGAEALEEESMEGTGGMVATVAECSEDTEDLPMPLPILTRKEFWTEVNMDTWVQHLTILREVFRKLQRAGLTAKPSKCYLGMETLEYLGHVLGRDVMWPKSSLVEKIQGAPRPQTKKELRSFLGLSGYYRKFIPHYSTIATPLTDLTRKNTPNRLVWTQDQERAFQTLKDRLSQEPILLLPDVKQEFILRTDASNVGLGAVLLQEQAGESKPIAYASRKLLPREERYSVVEKECLSIVSLTATRSQARQEEACEKVSLAAIMKFMQEQRQEQNERQEELRVQLQEQSERQKEELKVQLQEQSERQEKLSER